MPTYSNFSDNYSLSLITDVLNLMEDIAFVIELNEQQVIHVNPAAYHYLGYQNFPKHIVEYNFYLTESYLNEQIIQPLQMLKRQLCKVTPLNHPTYLQHADKHYVYCTAKWQISQLDNYSFLILVARPFTFIENQTADNTSERSYPQLVQEIREKTLALELQNQALQARSFELLQRQEDLEQEIARRQTAEASLRLHEERLNLAMQGSNDGWWDWEISAKSMYYSPRFCEILGFIPDSLTPDITASRIYPEDLIQLKQSLRAYLSKENEHYDHITRIQHRDGHYLWTRVKAKGIWDDTGKPVRMVGTLTDITNEYEANNKLRHTFNLLSRFKTALDLLRDSVYIISLENQRFIYANQSALQESGYSEQELYTITPREIDSGYLKTVRLEDSPISTGESNFMEFESIRLRKDGSTLPIYLILQKITLDDGVPCLVAISRNISEQKRIEQQLRDSELRFSLALRATNEGIWDWDIVNHHLYFSPRWKTMLGYSEEETIPPTIESFLNFLHPDDYWIKEKVKDYLEGKIDTYHFIIRLRHKAGYYAWIATRGTLERDADGKPLRMVGTHQDLTEQKQAEIELRRQKTILDKLIKNSPFAIFAKDVKDNFKWIIWNPKAEELFGLPAVVGLGKTDYDFFPKEEADFFRKMDTEIFIKRQTIDIPKEPVTTARGFFWAHTIKIPIFDENNEPEILFGILEDITERIEHENKLSASEQRYRSIYESMRDGFVIIDLDSKILQCNTAYSQILGYQQPSDLIGHNCRIFTPERWYLYENEVIIPQVLTRGYSDIYEKEYINCNNQILPIEMQVYAMKNADEQITGMWGFVRDISERKKVERELRQFATVIEQAPDMIGIADVNTQKILYLNPAGRKILNIPLHENIEYMYIADFFNAQELIKIQEEVIPNIIKYGIYRTETNLQNFTHKQLIPVDGSCFSITDTKGNVVSISMISRDISEKRRAEAELIAAKEAAESANRAKSVFLANMSHELRTPLNGILGYAQILWRDKTLNEVQREGINVIQRSGEYLLTLINDVLDLAKIEAERTELYFTDFDFSEFLQNITSLFQLRAEQKGISFIFEPTSALPQGIHCDEKRLRQILLNLLSNAVKFTQQGGVVFSVSYDGNKTRFKITDTGIGIAEEDIQHIFKPFKQVGDQRYQAEGTGLGLTITKHLINMLGGELTVESQLNHGSCFQFSLVLPEVNVLIRYSDENQRVIVGYHGKRQRLLVVDDRRENRLVLYHLLTPLGFELVEAENGKTGYETACSYHPDLILTDLVMPTLDGFTFVRQLRQLPEFKNTPIVAVSASVFDFHQQQSREVGCDDFIAKPIRADLLLKTLQRLLNLEWVYDETIAFIPKESTKQNVEEIDDLVRNYILMEEDASSLNEFALMGDLGGVLDKCKQLKQYNSNLTPLLNKIEQLAKNFQLEEISNLVAPYLNKD